MPINLPLPIARSLGPADTFLGERAIASLRGLPACRAVLIQGGSISPANLDKATRAIKAETVQTLQRPGGEPSVLGLEELAQQVDSASEVDLIVAVGGGSTMDMAKLLLLTLEIPEFNFSDPPRPFALPRLKERCRLTLVPTTAGSGSEASSAAVITMPDGRKVPILTHDFLPDLAVLDPSFLIDCPPSVMAAALTDAVIHAVEGRLSIVDNPLADALGEKAIQLIDQSFSDYSADSADPNTILQLQIAAHLAGVVQNLCAVGNCHAIAHSLGDSGLSHGAANGVFFEAVANRNAEDPEVASRLARLDALVSRGGIFGLLHKLRDFGSLPATHTLSEDACHRTAANAVTDHVARFNPIEWDLDDFAKIIRATRL